MSKSNTGKKTQKKSEELTYKQFKQQQEDDPLVRFIITGCTLFVDQPDFSPNTTHLQKIISDKAEIKAKRIKSLEFIYQNRAIEVIFYESDQEAISGAITSLKTHAMTQDDFKNITVLSESYWHAMMSQKEYKKARLQEIKRLEDCIFKLGCTLKASKYETITNRTSDVWIMSLCTLNRSLTKEVVKLRLKSKINQILQNQDTEDLIIDPGMISDVSDVEQAISAFKDLVGQPQTTKSTPDETNTAAREPLELSKTYYIDGKEFKLPADLDITVGQIIGTKPMRFGIYNLSNEIDVNAPFVHGDSLVIVTEEIDKFNIDISIGNEIGLLNAPKGILIHHLIPNWTGWNVMVNGKPYSKEKSFRILKSIELKEVNEMTGYCDFFFISFLLEFVFRFARFRIITALCVICWMPQVASKPFYIQFNNQRTNLHLRQAGTVLDVLVSMLSRGNPYGEFTDSKGNSIPLSTPLTKAPSHLRLIQNQAVANDISTSNDLTLRVAALNIHGIDKKSALLNEFIIRQGIHLLFFSEGKVKHNHHFPRNFKYYNIHNGKYGCGIVYNPSLLPECELNVIEANDVFICLAVKDTRLLFIYRPPANTCMDYYQKHIKNLITENTLVFGDANIDPDRDTTDIDKQAFLDSLNLDNLTLFDVPNNLGHTYMNSRGHTSSVDLVFYNLEANYRITHSQFVSTVPYLSDHECIILDIELQEEPICILGKRPKWNVGKFKDENNVLIFQNEVNVNVFRNDNEFYTLCNQMKSSTDAQQRQDFSNKIFDTIVSAFHQAGEIAISKTKKHHFISNLELAKAAEASLMGKDDLADKILKESRKNNIKQFNNNRNNLSSSEMLKNVSHHVRRKAHPGVTLDCFRTNEYLAELNKWNMEDTPIQPTDAINNFTPSLVVTVDSLRELISKLPAGKSPGDDEVINEFLIYSPDSILNWIAIAFNVALETGITPYTFHDNLIIAIYKGGGRLHRLMLKKLYERFLKPQAMPFLNSGPKQFAYKKGVGTADAASAADLFIKSIPAKIRRLYDIYKLDVDGAFDNIEHRAIELFFDKSDMEPYLKNALKNLVINQSVQLCIGSNRSAKKFIRRGIIQGSVLSPMIFTALVYSATKDIVIKDGTYIWYADDLLIICPKNQTKSVNDSYKRALLKIGLAFNPDKTEFIQDKYVRYLGYMMNWDGLNKDQQIKKNLSKCREKIRQLARSGVFRNSLKHGHLLRALSSFILPKLEYGLQLFEPTQTHAEKCASFLSNCVRKFCGVASYAPTEDIESLYGISFFMDRWLLIRARELNRVAAFNNNFDAFIYEPPAKMKFSLDKDFYNLLTPMPYLYRFARRNYPNNKGHDCTKCNKRHKHVNQIYKCRLRDVEITEPKCDKETLKIQFERFSGVINEIQSKLNQKQVCIYSDASNHSRFESTAGIVIIRKHNVEFQSYNLSGIDPTSSTRAEIAAICAALKNTIGFKREIFCDSTNAIKAFDEYVKNVVPKNKISSVDLIVQTRNLLQDTVFTKVKGHDKEDLYNLNHLADALTHVHSDSEAVDLEFRSNINLFERVEARLTDCFRIHDMKDILKGSHRTRNAYFAKIAALHQFLLS